MGLLSEKTGGAIFRTPRAGAAARIFWAAESRKSGFLGRLRVFPEVTFVPLRSAVCNEQNKLLAPQAEAETEGDAEVCRLYLLPSFLTSLLAEFPEPFQQGGGKMCDRPAAGRCEFLTDG